MLGEIELNKLADKYASKASKAMERYQETGERRYYNEYVRNDDITDAMRIAANASEDHYELVQLRNSIADFAAEMQSKMHDDCSSVVNAFVRYAARNGLIRKTEVRKKG